MTWADEPDWDKLDRLRGIRHGGIGIPRSAIGRLAPDYYCMDGTIPRRELPAVLGRIRELSSEFRLEVANVFHAGDGNLHPLILYDANVPGQLERAEELGAEILRLCVAHGGVLTGEHGVGVEKRDLMGTMFSEVDLAQQQRVKCAFDVDGRFNPGKVFPVLHRCAELGRVHVHAGQTRFPDLPRGPVHADLFRDNALFEKGRISGVVDFYFAGVDCLLYDVAVCVNDWCLVDPQADRRLDEARCRALLDAWIANWADIVDFEVIPVITSPEASEQIRPRL